MTKLSPPEARPGNLADQLERLPLDEARDAFGRLKADQCAAVVTELETADAAILLEAFPDVRVAACLQRAPQSLAADLVGMLPVERRAQVLSELMPEKGCY